MKKSMLLGLVLMLGVPAISFAIGASAPNVATSSAGLKAGKASQFKKPLPSFNKADTNGDHEIEWKEAKAAGVPRALFKRYDYRHKNKLTETEWKLVGVAMINLNGATLPKPGSSKQPPVPASVAASMGTKTLPAISKTSAAPVTRMAPSPSTG